MVIGMSAQISYAKIAIMIAITSAAVRREAGGRGQESNKVLTNESTAWKFP